MMSSLDFGSAGSCRLCLYSS